MVTSWWQFISQQHVGVTFIPPSSVLAILVFKSNDRTARDLESLADCLAMTREQYQGYIFTTTRQCYNPPLDCEKAYVKSHLGTVCDLPSRLQNSLNGRDGITSYQWP